jgi:peptidase E
MELLLLSGSRTLAGYLTDYLPEIEDFSAGTRRAVVVPFAAVSVPWAEYATKVSEATGLELHPLEELGRATSSSSAAGTLSSSCANAACAGCLSPCARVRESAGAGHRPA